MWGQDQQALRKVWQDAHTKAKQQLPLTALEQQLWRLIQAHPEYELAIVPAEQASSDPTAQAQAFLHLSLHLSIEEMIATDRPQGLKQHYQEFSQYYQDEHLALHHMMQCLFECWQEIKNASDVEGLNHRLLDALHRYPKTR